MQYVTNIKDLHVSAWPVWCVNCKIAHGMRNIQFGGFGRVNVPSFFDKVNWIDSLPYIQCFRNVTSLQPQSIQHLAFKVSPSVPWSRACLLVVPEGRKPSTSKLFTEHRPQGVYPPDEVQIMPICCSIARDTCADGVQVQVTNQALSDREMQP